MKLVIRVTKNKLYTIEGVVTPCPRYIYIIWHLPGMVADIYIHSILKAEAKVLLQVEGQPELCSKALSKKEEYLTSRLL